MSNTVELYRVFACSADRVYRAFTDPAAFAKWLPPHGFVATVHAMDARIGGRYRMSFTNMSNAQSHAFSGEYRKLETDRQIAYSASFDGLPGEMLTTVALRPVDCGVEVRIRQEGIPAAIPVEGCHLGWQQSLVLLQMLVEAEPRG